ncbi:MFS transporter, partial [Sulfurospirillum sp.]|nr:MFS transporter [Sulfurospirillum sp.]
ASVMIISFLAHSIMFNEFLWIGLRFFAGFSFYAILIILESWLNEKSTHDNRGKILAIYSIVFYLATALGQLFLNIEGKFREYIFTMGSILVLFSIILISLIKVKEPTLKPFEKYSLPKIYSVVPLAFTASLIGGFLIGGFFTMVPIYLLEKYDSIEIVSYFMTFALVGGLLAQWPIGVLSDKYGRRKLIAFNAFVCSVTSILFLFVIDYTLYIYTLGFFLGASIFSLYPLAVARANDVVDENKDILEISRTLLYSYGIGSFISPLIIGFILNYNREFLFVLFASICLFLTLYSRSKKRIADDDMSVYVNIPAVSSPELSQLDPRQDE